MKGVPLTISRRESMTMRSLPSESMEDLSSALFSDFSMSPHSSESAGRLQMANDFIHHPVLAEEIVELFTGLPAGIIVDATLGGAGHARLLLNISSSYRLLGVDRDPSARAAAENVLAHFGDRVRVVPGTFGDLSTVIRHNEDFISPDAVVGVLLDLGVSSPQLDHADRGFSFRFDAPLDMRMDPTSGPTAAELLASMDLDELTGLLRKHGEGRFARAMARSILERSPQTTSELVECVERVVPMAARRRGNVATRVFQALRVEVNGEEAQLHAGLHSAIELLAPGGVLAVISYHSGEDRTTKSVLHDGATGGCSCPVELGCVCGAVKTLRLLKASAVMASNEEIESNPRARSARLRAAWKVAT
jgi:16S rRNA (cytosine1402-N4)-methyltransferase